MHFTMAIIVEHIWPMIFSYFVFSWVLYDPWLLLHLLHLLHLHEPYVCHGSYMPHDCSALSLSCVMGPIWSMTALTFVTFVTFTWTLHLSWLLCTEPVMRHGSYMIHDCSTRSLTFFMAMAIAMAMCYESKVAPMTALHGVLHVSWALIWIHDFSTRSLYGMLSLRIWDGY